MIAISERQSARFYIFEKQKMRNFFIYKKRDNSLLVFIYKIHDTLRNAIFHEIFEVGIYIQKS